MSRSGAAIVALGVMWAVLAPAREGPRTLDRTVALVNSDIVTLGQVREEERNKLLHRFVIRQSKTTGLMGALERMIDYRLLVQAARRARVPVSEADILARVEELIADTEMQHGGREAYRRHLKEAGVDLAALKKNTRRWGEEHVLVSGLISSRVSVNREDVAAFEKECREKNLPTEAYTLRHLLLRCPADASAEQKSEVRERALAIQQKLQDGGSYLELVLKFSEDAGTRDDFGWLGTLAPDDLDPAVLKAVGGLKSGQYSAPVWTRSGCHIFLMKRRHTARETLLIKRMDEAQTALVKQLRKEAVIEILDERLRPTPPKKNEKKSEQ
jgi:parvulin-like peptidyl-prolyl isomerase